MSRRKGHVLRTIQADEGAELRRIAESGSVPLEWVRRAKVLLLVERGVAYLVAVTVARQMVPILGRLTWSSLPGFPDFAIALANQVIY